MAGNAAQQHGQHKAGRQSQARRATQHGAPDAHSQHGQQMVGARQRMAQAGKQIKMAMCPSMGMGQRCGQHGGQGKGVAKLHGVILLLDQAV